MLIDRKAWFATNAPDITRYLPPTQGGEAKGPKWRTLKMTWTPSSLEGSDAVTSGMEEIEQIVNMQTLEMYGSDPKALIWVKCYLLLVGRPLYTIAKTAYHMAFPLSIPIEVIRAIINRDPLDTSEQVARKALLFAARSLADIGRTPLCGIALSAIVLVGAAVAPFLYLCKPDFLYDIRDAAGKVDLWMNWGNHKALPFIHILAPCFQPLDPFELAQKAKFSQKYDNTVYASEDPVFIAINNYVRLIFAPKYNEETNAIKLAIDANTFLNSYLFCDLEEF